MTTPIVDFIQTKKLNETARLLTQAYRVGAEKHIPVNTQTLVRIFPDTLAASFSGSKLITLGTGQMSAEDHASILTQYAFDLDKPVAEVGREYIELIGMFGRDSQAFRKVTAAILGSADKTTRYNSISPVAPTFVLTTIAEILSTAKIEAPEIYQHLLTDFICHLLRPFGWILMDAGYVHRIHRVRVFPSFKDVVNMLAQKELSRVLSAMQRADMSVVKRSVDAKAGLSPSMISSYMASSLLRAYELARGTYDPTSVAASVLTLMARSMSPTTPSELYPRERLLKSVLPTLNGNFALFLAAQDMIRNHPQVVGIHHGDEEMATQILPMFQDAILTNAIFRNRIASDVVDFVGKRSSTDRYRAPRKVAIYENFNASGHVEAFVPVRHLRDSKSRYLPDQADIAGALSSMMRPVAELFSTRAIVESRMTAFDTAVAELTDPSSGVDIYMAMPSLIEREVATGLPVGSLMMYMRTGEVPDVTVAVAEGEAPKMMDSALVRRILDGMAYDHYAMVMHLALQRASDQTVSVISTPAAMGADTNMTNIAIAWDIRTDLVHPLGASALLASAVMTTEPLEAIVYQDDYEARKALIPADIKLSDYRDHVHIWDWYSASTKLSSSGTYVTRIGEKSFTVTVEEFEMLGMGARRRMAYFLTPHATAAVARMWCEWIEAEGAFVTERSKKGDDLTRATFRGLERRSGISLVTVLATIGNSATGSRISEAVRQSLAEQLYAADMVDQIPRLALGLFHVRIRVWAGLQTLGVLGLLTPEMINIIFERIRTTDAMAAFVAIDQVTRIGK